MPSARVELEAFVRDACGDVTVSFAGPRDDESGGAVHCILIGLSPNPLHRNSHHQPLQIDHRYLVCTSVPDEAGVDLLEAMIFRRLEGHGPDIEMEPPPYELWRALGLVPQPGFILRLPVYRARARAEVPTVQTVDLQISPTRSPSAGIDA